MDKSLLYGVEDAVLFEVFDGADSVSSRHCGKHGAALDRLFVHPDNARPAVGRVASPVGAGEAERVTQEVDEQKSSFDLLGLVAAIYVDCYFHD